jgi:hypothetical protein
MSYITTISMPDDLVETFKHLAEMRGQSKSAFLCDYIREMGQKYHSKPADCPVCRRDRMVKEMAEDPYGLKKKKKQQEE